MRASLILIAASACGTTVASEGTGTVVYIDRTSGDVVTVDVATGAMTAFDSGSLTAVSIARDGQHIAYSSFADGMMRVADRAKNVTILSPSTCGTPAVWMTNDSLLYCEVGSSTSVVAPLGSPPRHLAAATFLTTWTADGAQLVYVRPTDLTQTSTRGDVVLENADGSAQRVLLANTNIQQISIAPDMQRAVVVVIPESGVRELHVLPFAGGDHGLGLATSIATMITNGPTFSPRGTEILAVDDTGLVAADLDSGVHRPLFAVATAGGMAAAFIDEDRTISEHGFQIDIAGGAKDIAIASSTGSQQCTIADLAIDAQLAAVECTIPAIIDFAGNTLTGHIADTALGLSADGQGMVTVAGDGTIEYVRLDGTSKQLGVTSGVGGNTPLIPAAPRVLAAYAP